MNILNALIKGLLAVLLLMWLIILASRWFEAPPGPITHTSFMTEHGNKQLTNNNIVDVLSSFLDTTSLHAVKLQQGVLKVELMLNNETPINEQIYQDVPHYISLAFQYANNVERLDLIILQAEGTQHVELKLMQLTITSQDEWLVEGIELLYETKWLDQSTWIERLRIERFFNWDQDNYVVIS